MFGTGVGGEVLDTGCGERVWVGVLCTAGDGGGGEFGKVAWAGHGRCDAIILFERRDGVVVVVVWRALNSMRVVLYCSYR